MFSMNVNNCCITKKFSSENITCNGGGNIMIFIDKAAIVHLSEVKEMKKNSRIHRLLQSISSHENCTHVMNDKK